MKESIRSFDTEFKVAGTVCSKPARRGAAAAQQATQQGMHRKATLNNNLKDEMLAATPAPEEEEMDEQRVDSIELSKLLQEVLVQPCDKLEDERDCNFHFNSWKVGVVHAEADFSEVVLDLALDCEGSLLKVKSAHAWTRFSAVVLCAFPAPHRTKLDDFTRNTFGCLPQHHVPGLSASRETVALADHVCRRQKERNKILSMLMLKNWVTHELCVEAFAKANECTCPGLEQQRDKPTVGKKNSDLYLPAVHTHIEIKTWV